MISPLDPIPSITSSTRAKMTLDLQVRQEKSYLDYVSTACNASYASLANSSASYIETADCVSNYVVVSLGHVDGGDYAVCNILWALASPWGL